MRRRQATPRGVRNNNPLNIRRSGDKWRGLAEVQTDPAFCQFEEMKWGVRAAVVILRNYQKRYNLRTLRQIITRWAPPVENDTSAYVMNVSRRAKIQADVPIDLSSRSVLMRLIEAMWYVENGVAGDVVAISRGLDLLGL